MMMGYSYEVGQKLELPVVDKGINTNDMPYLEVYHADTDRRYRIFNLLKFQYDYPPDSMYVKVAKVDVFGKVFMMQDLERVFKDLYKVGGMYKFDIKDRKTDTNTKAEYLELEDENFIHRWYAPDTSKYELGTGCILEIDGFTPKGYLKLSEVKHGFTDNDIVKIDLDLESEGDDSPTQGFPTLQGVEEGDTVELKSSIVFPPGKNHTADIEAQLKNIVKAIVSFMNANGGSLYIGVKDRNKEICGIEGDYSHLNDNSDNDYDDYKPDRDGFELKIRHAIERNCQGVAGMLISFNFLNQDGKEYCRIDVKPAKRPIWVNGNILYVRQGNKSKMLKGDDITTFITSRTTISIREIIDTDDLNIAPISINTEELENVLKRIINSVPTDLPKAKAKGETDYWITWFDDMSWKRTRGQQEADNKSFEVAVPKNSGNLLLAFCYTSGTVNIVRLADFKRGANLNKTRSNGWARSGEKPVTILLLEQNEYIVGYAKNSDGSYVKLHAATDFNPSQSAANQGSRFAPQDCMVDVYAKIGPEAASRFPNLIVPGTRKTSVAGIPLNSPNSSQEIKALESFLKE